MQAKDAIAKLATLSGGGSGDTTAPKILTGPTAKVVNSNLGLETFFRSKGTIPEVFLQRAGAPAVLLIYEGPWADPNALLALGQHRR